MTTPSRHLTRSALSYAARGWHVFPLVPNAKRPAVTAWEDRATTDPERIRTAWSSAPFGIGIACGPSRLVVVDLDVPKPDADGCPPEPPPALRRLGVRTGVDVFAVLAELHGAPRTGHWTYATNTGRGGAHLYFSAPDLPTGEQLRNTAGALGWLIDTRAAGGYVVAPPSVVDGRGYTVAYEANTAPLPDWLTAVLRPRLLPTPAPAAGRQSEAGEGHPYVRAAIDGQRRHITAAPPGRRNHTLYISAVALGQLVAGGALDEHQAAAQLLDAAAPHIAAGAFTARDARLTIASGFRAGAHRPRSVPTTPTPAA